MGLIENGDVIVSLSNVNVYNTGILVQLFTLQLRWQVKLRKIKTMWGGLIFKVHSWECQNEEIWSLTTRWVFVSVKISGQRAPRCLALNFRASLGRAEPYLSVSCSGALGRKEQREALGRSASPPPHPQFSALLVLVKHLFSHSAMIQ